MIPLACLLFWRKATGLAACIGEGTPYPPSIKSPLMSMIAVAFMQHGLYGLYAILSTQCKHPSSDQLRSVTTKVNASL